MEKIIKNRAVILFYVVMIGMTLLLLGKLERFHEISEVSSSVVYAIK